MRICLVVAMTSERVIGRDGQLPWHLPADLRHFRRVTLGHPVIMGRKTFESIGSPLPGRTNIVITRRRDYDAPGCVLVRSPEDALHAAAGVRSAEAEGVRGRRRDAVEQQAMVIGGSSVYRAFLPRVQRMYVTIVHARVDGDTYFPEFARDEWREVERVDHDADERNEHPYSFIILDRLTGAAPEPAAGS